MRLKEKKNKSESFLKQECFSRICSYMKEYYVSKLAYDEEHFFFLPCFIQLEIGRLHCRTGFVEIINSKLLIQIKTL